MIDMERSRNFRRSESSCLNHRPGVIFLGSGQSYIDRRHIILGLQDRSTEKSEAFLFDRVWTEPVTVRERDRDDDRQNMC